MTETFIMIKPTDFYYDETQSIESFTRTPTANFDVNRMIAGKSSWIMSALPRKLKPKKLVLADWTVANWSNEKRGAMTEALTGMMDKGFEVYAWDNDQLKPLSKETVALSLKTLSSHPAIPEDILKAAALKKITRDQIHIIDDYWAEQFCHPDKDIPRELRASDYLSLADSDRKKIIDIIRRAKPK